MSNSTTPDLDDEIQFIGSSGLPDPSISYTEPDRGGPSGPTPQSMEQLGIDHQRQNDSAFDTLERSTRGLSVSKSRELPHQVHPVPAVSVGSRHLSKGSSRGLHSRHNAKKGHSVNHGQPVVKAKIKRRLTRAVDEVYRRLFASQAHRALPQAPRMVPSRQIERRLGEASRVAGMSRTRKPVRTDEVIEDGRTVVKRFWPCVRLGHRTLKPGDAVSVKLKDSVKRGLIRSLFEKTSTGSLAKRRWFAHVHWLGTSSVTGEELVLRGSQCDDIAFEYIVGKVDLTGRPVRIVYEESRAIWRDPVDPVAGDKCDSCHQRAEIREKQLAVWEDHQLVVRGEAFHVHDFVLFDEGRTGEAWSIGHVVSWPKGAKRNQPKHLEVRLLKRQSELVHAGTITGFADEKRLYVTDTYTHIDPSSIIGKCVVLPNLESIPVIEDPLVFYCSERLPMDRPLPQPLQRPLRRCTACQDRLVQRLQDQQQLLALENKLPAVDLYSGAGGAILGAHGLFRVTTAVDLDPTACRTLQDNFADLDVLCAKVSSLHHRALLQDDGELCEERPFGPPGSAFLLSAGPPCQGHSGANRFKDPLDPRNEELVHTMSEVDRLRPDYVVFENVRGFKSARGDGTFTDDTSVGSFAEMAIALLVGICYQAKLAELDARSYGSPQNRVRCLIIAARRGISLASFPAPTHANPRPPSSTFALEGGERGFYVHIGTPGTGPLPSITASQTISDLPGFPAPPRRGTPAFPSAPTAEGKNTQVGFRLGRPYDTGPQNAYQKRMRGGGTVLRDHFTAYLTPRELRDVYEATSFVGDKDDSCVPGTLRRAHPDHGFHTLLTSSKPGGKATGAIHWQLNRTFSVAERKRAMGFPDDFRLAGTPEDMDRLLGNAMVVDVMRAIYRQIIRDVVLPWWIQAGRPEAVRDAWRRDHPI
ncbi:hypothetical protein EHS25_004546 [Saitozyma podzolica]|uniref:DNA (cytosine-5-)-methyltransferase n=1 Tax=Saitozyma podzolica TaxID=1890683 RepID=A0A427YUR3_9TREE|nr:hypothetical protein EHS25_004546 [Saitozyma podzolica]